MARRFSRTGLANLANQPRVARAIEHADHEIFDAARQGTRNALQVVRDRRVEEDGVLGVWPDHQLLHVQVGRVQQAALIRRGEHGQGIGLTRAAQVGSFQRIDGDVDPRHRPSIGRPVVGVSPPHLLADVERQERHHQREAGEADAAGDGGRKNVPS